jgi:hypothetical protein
MKSFLIYEEMRNLQLLPSELPDIWGKFDFLFLLVRSPIENAYRPATLIKMESTKTTGSWSSLILFKSRYKVKILMQPDYPSDLGEL